MNVTTKDIGTALRTKLNVASIQALGVASGDVFDSVASKAGVRPFVRYQMIDAGDEETFGQRVYQWFEMLVVAHTADDRDKASNIGAEIDTLLQRTSLTISGATHDITFRRRQFERFENGPDGRVYYQSGGIYYIGVRPS